MKLLFHNKRGLMGIGTLIIFIAVIIVAAVAAFVLVMTSNTLQQRALLSGTQVRKALTNSVHVLSVSSDTNRSAEKFKDFEIMLQLAPGSDPLRLDNMFFEIRTSGFDITSTFIKNKNLTTQEIDEISVNDTVPIIDLNGDGLEELLGLYSYNDSENNYDYIMINFSDGTVSDRIIIPDLSNATLNPVRIRLAETPIKIGEKYFGVVEINGITNKSNTIISNVTFKVKTRPETCNFNVLPPEQYFCAVKVIDLNKDDILNLGERFKILIKLNSTHYLGTGEKLSLLISTEGGLVNSLELVTPDVIESVKEVLWPLG